MLRNKILVLPTPVSPPLPPTYVPSISALTLLERVLHFRPLASLHSASKSSTISDINQDTIKKHAYKCKSVII